MIHPPPASLSLGIAVCAAVKHACQIRVKDAIPVGVAHRRDFDECADAGVVDQGIEAAEPRGDVGDHALDGGTIPYVHGGSGDASRVAGAIRQRVHGGLDPRPIPTRNHHASAIGQNGLSDRETYSA